MEEVELDLAKVTQLIQDGFADLNKARRCGNEVMILEIRRNLNYLFEEKKRLEIDINQPKEAATEQVGSSYKTPSPSKGSPKRNSAKQDSFRNKLIRRSKKRTTCDICSCDVGYDGLESAHIIDLAKREILEAAFDELENVLPASVNDSCNGLLLCPTCHLFFDKGKIQISGTGKIMLCSDLKKTYKDLHDTMVPWASHIGNHRNYPSQELLELALETKPAPKKRLRELIEESEESEEDVQIDETQSVGVKTKSQRRSQPTNVQGNVASKKGRKS